MVRPDAGEGRRLTPIYLGAIVAAIVVVGLAAWLLLGGDDDNGEQAAAGARAVSVEELQDVAGGRDTPVFWAGPRSGRKYEYTETRDGSAYVRYLPSNAE